jgi:hypothetical protein
LVAPAPASSATLDCNALAVGAPGVTVTIVDNVCRFLFIPTDVNSNYWTLTVPAGVTKVSALLVGAGGSGASDGNRSAAGGGGEVVYIDSFDASTPLQIQAGFGGYTVPVDGTSSIQGVTPEARPGSHGVTPASIPGQIIGGESGTGRPGGTANITQSGFHSASGGGQLDAGDHFAGDLGDLGSGMLGGAPTRVGLETTDKSLWPETQSQGRLLARGGSVMRSGIEEVVLNALRSDGSGNGATLEQAKIANQNPRHGDHGSVEIRFSNLVDTTVIFDANGGTGTMANQVSKVTAPLSSNQFENPGFIFDGWNTAPDGSGTPYADADNFAFDANTTLFARWLAAPTANNTNTTPSYTGPTVTSATSAAPGNQVTLTGTNLTTVTSVEIDGVSIAITNETATRLTFTLPAAITPGLKDIKILSSFGTLTVQAILRVLSETGEETTQSTTQLEAWTKAQPDGLSVKVYARNIIGQGKIQFFVDGREVAWVRAIDPTDPKLRIQPDGLMAGTDYLVRTISLSPGKNRIEITLDGARIWQATYLPEY